MVYFLYQIKRGEDMNINNYMLISLNRISKKHGYTVTEITNSVIEDIILIKPDIPRRKYRQITEEQLDSLNLILDN